MNFCSKVKYRDKISAMFALSQCKKVGNYNPIRNECRIYFCHKCNSYHLTSQKR